MLFWLREKQGRKEERRGAGGEDEEGTGRRLGSEGGMTSEGKTRQSSQLLSPGLERGERGKEHRSRSRKKQIYSPATTSMNAKSDNKTIRHPKWTSRRFKGKLEKKWQVRFANTLWLLPSTERPSPSPFLSAVKKEKKKSTFVSPEWRRGKKAKDLPSEALGPFQSSQLWAAQPWASHWKDTSKEWQPWRITRWLCKGSSSSVPETTTWGLLSLLAD